MSLTNGTHILNQREKRMLFVGLDLETTDTDPSRAAIVQFASIARCPGWLRQSEETRSEISRDGGDHINVTLLAFADFCQGLDEIWAGPAHFDISILEHAYRQSSLAIPWSFRQVRCWSTFRRLVPIEKPPNSCEHNALADAQAQVAGFRQAWAKLRGTVQA